MPGIEGDGCVPGGGEGRGKLSEKLLGAGREMVDNLLTGNVEIPDDKLQVVFVGKL
jgi:hypothetical protein